MLYLALNTVVELSRGVQRIPPEELGEAARKRFGDEPDGMLA